MRTIVTAAAALLLGASVASSAGHEGSRSASFLVSVTVIAHTELEVVSEPSRLTITESDIARGFAVVPDVSRVRVRSTARDGYLLRFCVAPAPGWRLTVSGLGDQVVLAPGEGWIVQPSPRGIAELELRFTVQVPPGTAPGTYPWPVAIQATSL